MGISKRPETQNRVFYLDVLRVIACLCIVMIHTSGTFVTKNIGSADFWIGDFCDSISRVGIPLFVMISGALMLDENYAYSAKKIRKHILKMIIFFVFWSVIYCAWYDVIQPIRHGEAVTAERVLKALILGPYHFWFVYLIIGLYLIVPLLRLWVKKENKRYIQYFLILSLIFCFLIPQIISIGKNFSEVFETADEFISRFHLDYIAGYTMYYVLGWYLNTFELPRRKLFYALGVLGLAATFFGTYILAVTIEEPALMYDNLQITIVMQSVAVFVFIRQLFAEKQGTSRFVSIISKYSLGVYAVHIIILENLLPVLLRFNITSAFLHIPIIFIATLILSVLVTALFSKIPLLKKVV